MCREGERERVSVAFQMIVSTGECIASFRFLCNSEGLLHLYLYSMMSCIFILNNIIGAFLVFEVV